MIKIVFFTDSQAPLKYFSAFDKSNKWELTSFSCSKLRKLLKNPSEDTVYLLDYASVSEDNQKKELNYLLKKEEVPRIIIDRKNDIDDPASILMKGCDYLGSKFLKEGIKPARLNSYFDFYYGSGDESEGVAAGSEKADSGKKNKTKHIAVKDGWKEIKSGKDYTFYMLFTEISIPAEWKKKSGSRHLNNLKQTFQALAEREASLCNGKVWIWNEYGGLILFPYTGVSCSPVIAAVKLLLNRVISSVEDFNLHTPIELRAAMHLGITTWKKRGNTGTIISDSLNSIFHLGSKYTPLNDFDITEDVYLELLPELKKLFSETGDFEGRKIYRLCHFEVNS